MSVIADYANLYETQFRPRRRQPVRGLRYVGVLFVWSALFLVRPGLALAIWCERA